MKSLRTFDLNEIQADILTQLRYLRGTAWKDVKGEIHTQYNEMPFWLLLYEDFNLAQSHQTFRDIIRPFLNAASPLNITVSYCLADGKRRRCVCFLSGEKDIFDDAELSGWDDIADNGWRIDDRSFFDSPDSKRD